MSRYTEEKKVEDLSNRTNGEIWLIVYNFLRVTSDLGPDNATAHGSKDDFYLMSQLLALLLYLVEAVLMSILLPNLIGSCSVNLQVAWTTYLIYLFVVLTRAPDAKALP